MKRRLFAIALAASLSLGSVSIIATLAAGPPASGTSVSGSAVVSEAMKFLGYPYSYTGASPATGFSCIGFVSYVYHQLGVNMPGDLGDAMAAYPQVSESQLEPGDIIFFQNTWWPGVSHVAIYIGGGRIIHAENPQHGVTISSLLNDPSDGDYWTEHYLVAERPWAAVSSSISSEPTAPGTGASAPAPPPPPPPTPTPVPAKPLLVSGPTVTVIVPALNVRSGPSMNDSVITVVTQGTHLTVLGRHHRWFKVQLADGTIGWVVRAGVSRHGGATTRRSAPPQHQPSSTPKPPTTSKAPAASKMPTVGTPHAPSKFHTRKLTHLTALHLPTTLVRVNGLRVHNAPSLNAPVIAMLMQGERVGVLAHIPDWLKVAVSPSVIGWVVSQWVVLPKLPTPHKTTYHSAKPKPVIGSTPLRAGINVHSAPSLSASVITVSDGRPVRVLSSTNGWVKVQLANGVIGWVSGQFIAGYAVQKAPPKMSTERSIHLSGGVHVIAGVRIHSAPSLSAPTIAATSADMTVQVLGYSNGFAHVRCSNGVVGWIAAQFVGSAGTASRTTSHSSSTHASSQQSPSLTVTTGPHVTVTVHLRAAPGLTARVIGVVPIGTHVVILGSSAGWDLVRLPNGQTGYVFAAYIAG